MTVYVLTEQRHAYGESKVVLVTSNREEVEAAYCRSVLECSYAVITEWEIEND